VLAAKRVAVGQQRYVQPNGLTKTADHQESMGHVSTGIPRKPHMCRPWQEISVVCLMTTDHCNTILPREYRDNGRVKCWKDACAIQTFRVQEAMHGDENVCLGSLHTNWMAGPKAETMPILWRCCFKISRSVWPTTHPYPYRWNRLQSRGGLRELKARPRHQHGIRIK
jgi:hypothetical protein